MNFNKEYKERIEKAFGNSSLKINGMKMKNWLKDNADINSYLNEILKNEPRFSSIGNIIWAIRNNFDIDEYKCKTCGTTLKIIHPTQLRQYCSTKCAMLNETLLNKRNETISSDLDFYVKRQEKIRNTNMKKYGVDVSSKAESVKEKTRNTILNDTTFFDRRNAKSKSTCFAKYGVENPSQADEIKQKKCETCLMHYGVDVPIKSSLIKEKYKKTCIEKYGVDNSLKMKSTIDKINDKSWETINSWKEFIVPNFSRLEYTGYSNGQEYEWKCVKCGNVFKQALYHTKHLDINQFVPRCEKCYPKDHISSVSEMELLEYVRHFFPNAKKDRIIIKPFELDIVIPEIKLAIEFNGDYWHSVEIHTNKDYHLMKLNKCNDVGFRLIHIFEHEWKYKRDLVKEKLKTIFGFNYDSIYARNCGIKEIDTKTKNNFLNKYHIQGEDKSNVKLGLFHNNELVAVMTFGKPRFDKSYEWELIRYATSKHVIGGAGKLLKYFEKIYKPNSIVTYADRRWSQGNMYNKIGFSELDPILPGYFYVKDNIVLSRMQCQKFKLKKLLGNRFDISKSEKENMKAAGFLRIYDCGNLKFHKIFK